ncbi:MAG TPA: transcriptional repressor [Candidatus Eisenbacteria bacterium]|uniref:Transcriptional repressor n=1 Tax=Eiseniibacteriota bacterium TaxID=2212470 RepID=A0A7V2F3R7_UNCEI|nr:transcriptional repressor [Candidatus Eisenbacteria bacterium]
MDSFEHTIQTLRGKGFKLTPQRFAVIKYMIGNTNHPSALTIHKDLKKRYPSLSFSTVYNTLNVLEEIGEVTPIYIFSEHVNYDPSVEPHMHFLCTKCNRIHDIFPGDIEGVRLPAGEVAGHLIISSQVILRGICKDCR